MKRCPQCGETKPLDQFYRRANGKPLTYCRPCYSVRSAAYHAANADHHRKLSSEWAKANRAKINAARNERRKDPEYAARERAKDRARHPDRWIRTNYNLSRDQWNALLAKQGGVCAVCGATESRGIGSFHVDHDHSCCPGRRSCGKCVRGLLCNLCNPMIGHARDDPTILRKAATYLEQGGAMGR